MSGFFLDASKTPEIQGNVVSFVTSQSQIPSSRGGGSLGSWTGCTNNISRRGIITFSLGFQWVCRAQ